MSYTPGIPNANDLINSSQSQIRTNFVELNTQFAIDHIAFDAGANNGKHSRATLLQQGSDQTTAAAEGSVYTKAVGSRTELFYRGESNGPVVELSVIKAWGSFTGSTGALTDSFNIASVTRNAAGNYSVAFTDALANANYGVVVTTQLASGFTTGGIAGIDSRTANGFDIFVRALSGAFGVDVTPVSFVVIGS